MQLKTLCYH